MKKKFMSFRTLQEISCFILLILLLAACRKSRGEDPVPPAFTSGQGFYLLNEGNMGRNNATLDYAALDSGKYYRNIYGGVNPTVPKELGDVGNDIAIYGSKLYAVISCSNKIEVMDAKTAKRIGQIEIPNCRNIIFYNGFGYVTSYAGPVQQNPDFQQVGYVAKIDTGSLQVLNKCLVGQQPDGLAIANHKIYVANSGGYLYPNYENTVSVIDLTSFKETQRIKVDINLYRVCADKQDNVWVTSNGDYSENSSKLFCIDSKTDQVTDSINIVVSNFWLDENKLYIIGVAWNYETSSSTVSYGVVDVVSKQVVSRKFISDGTEGNIITPYGIAVHPITKDIYVSDAKDYISPGVLYCFSKEGKQKWNERTGVNPAHFAFYRKK